MKKLRYDLKKKKEKLNLFGANSSLDMSLLKMAHIELFSNRKITVEGCNGVYEYNDNYLKLRLTDGALILCGREFDIISFEGKTIIVNGEIKTLEFCD